MSETDPEDRDLAEQLAGRGDPVHGGRRVARAVREEHAVEAAVRDRRCRCLGRVDRASDPVVPESLVRMASIPHGTTINAEGLSVGARDAGQARARWSFPASVRVTLTDAGGGAASALTVFPDGSAQAMRFDVNSWISLGKNVSSLPLPTFVRSNACVDILR